MIADPDSEIDRRQAAAASLRTLMRLPVAQRSSVILMDVLGHSLEEIAVVLDGTVPAVKAALHRGRIRLRELAAEPDDRPPPVLAEADRARLAAYTAALQRARLRRPARSSGRRGPGRGREPHAPERAQRGRAATSPTTASRATGSWSRDWSNGGRRCWSTIREDPDGAPLYFILLDWTGERLLKVRDFRYARYVTDGAELIDFR